VKAFAFSLCLLLPAGLLAQAPKKTLAQFLAANPVANGLAVGAEEVVGNGNNLAQFNRKAIRIGGVTAIVPLQMIRFEDAPRQAPNLYDGLPRDAKVLYLMSTLTPEQWRLAGGRGIGAGDLRDEPRDVFLSLLPKTLKWKRYRTAENQGSVPVAEGTVDPNDLPKVRLRIEQRLNYLIPLADREGAYTARDPDQDFGQPGSETLRRETEEERNPMTSFGFEVRATVPNTLKKGQLDTAALGSIVTLPPKATVAGVLKRIGAETGREILADVRVRDLGVSFPGGKARAGDLLDALALAVTGTYRKVGETYLLVSDVVGAGARKLRFSIWQDEVGILVAEREDLWRQGLAKSGLVRHAKNDANDPLQATEGIQGHLSKAELGQPKFFPTEELSAEQRTFLTRTLAFDKEGRYQRDRVGVESNLKYRFILPDGKALQPEGYLGPETIFRPRAPYRIPTDREQPLATNPEGIARPLVVSLAQLSEVRTAAALAKAFGFNELWVQTDRQEVLAAAVATGIPTRLFARPWETPGESDRTLLGETGRMVLTRLNGSSPWGQVADMIRMQSFPRLGPVTVAGDFISPWGPQWAPRKTHLATLGRTEGLAGVVLTDAMPHGYEAKEDNATVGSYMRERSEMWAFGYDVNARLAFVRAHGIDPVDIVLDRVRFEVDMYTPFFSRYPKGQRVVDDAADNWLLFRAQANERAMAELGKDLGGVPILIDIRRRNPSQPPLHAATLRRWSPGAPLPSYEGQYILDRQDGDIRLLTAPWPQMAAALTDFVNAGRVFGAQKELPLAVDLTRIPATRWNELLARSFEKK
jgi:8-oxo-dGTP pyrophosphatase MutT (NUDIX family)